MYSTPLFCRRMGTRYVVHTKRVREFRPRDDRLCRYSFQDEGLLMSLCWSTRVEDGKQ